MDQVRTRFAPSPTGALHVGNVRIAVFNWLFARHHGGAFLLRVEDTDPERNLPGAEAAILEDLRWLRLDWDEGPDVGGPAGPYRQSERLPLYRRHAEELVQAGKAYRCYCSPDELGGNRWRDAADTDPVHYSGRCRDLTEAQRQRLEAEGRVPAIRFRMPLGRIEVVDEIKGAVSFAAEEFGDFVILRADGRPVYNFAVVVDDALMRITHVIRGVGHLSNTPKHAVLFDALGFPRPRFAHLPMVLGADRRKLSKREAAAPVAELRAAGYHPDAVVNYLSLLGWSSPTGEEFLTRERLIADTTFARARESDAVFDLEKLRWLSARHIDAMPLDTLVDALRPWIDRTRVSLDGPALATAVAAVRSHLHTFAEINDVLAPFSPRDSATLAAAAAELGADQEALRILESARRALGRLEPWTEDAIASALREVGREIGVRGFRLFHPLRRAITGAESGPELVKVLAALGPEEAIARLEAVRGHVA
ncbi:MAG: glutamate--tRNA ligase [Gemmatimonadetes bacterium]|nr:glutamate--tRNA ligase [Gemmatimonadota bacterium]